MPDRCPSDELRDRSGPRDVLSERYRESLPDTITVSWTAFAEEIQAADTSIEYIAAIQRHLDDVDHDSQHREHSLPHVNRLGVKPRDILLDRL